MPICSWAVRSKLTAAYSSDATACAMFGHIEGSLGATLCHLPKLTMCASTSLPAVWVRQAAAAQAHDGDMTTTAEWTGPARPVSCGCCRAWSVLVCSIAASALQLRILARVSPYKAFVIPYKSDTLQNASVHLPGRCVIMQGPLPGGAPGRNHACRSCM